MQYFNLPQSLNYCQNSKIPANYGWKIIQRKIEINGILENVLVPCGKPIKKVEQTWTFCVIKLGLLAND